MTPSIWHWSMCGGKEAAHYPVTCCFRGRRHSIAPLEELTVPRDLITGIMPLCLVRQCCLAGCAARWIYTTPKEKLGSFASSTNITSYLPKAKALLVLYESHRKMLTTMVLGLCFISLSYLNIKHVTYEVFLTEPMTYLLRSDRNSNSKCLFQRMPGEMI